MKARALFAALALGAAVAAAPAAAKNKTDSSFARCDQNAHWSLDWSLCWWLSMVQDGKPTKWFDMW